MPDDAGRVKRIENSDGTRLVEFLCGSHGLFYFVELTYSNDEYGDYWSHEGSSCFYDLLEAAEQEARAVLPWLREQISN